MKGSLIARKSNPFLMPMRQTIRPMRPNLTTLHTAAENQTLCSRGADLSDAKGDHREGDSRHIERVLNIYDDSVIVFLSLFLVDYGVLK